jgi:hypothetical protein
MKSIFTIYLSADGMHTKCATNMKALYKVITELDKYTVLSIDGKELTYSRLVSVIRKAQNDNRFNVCRIQCENGNEILIQNPILISNCL